MVTTPDSVTYQESIDGVIGPTEAAPWLSTYRPHTPWPGLFGFATDTDLFEFWDGSQWLHPVWSEIAPTLTSPVTIGSTTATGTQILQFKNTGAAQRAVEWYTANTRRQRFTLDTLGRGSWSMWDTAGANQADLMMGIYPVQPTYTTTNLSTTVTVSFTAHGLTSGNGYVVPVLVSVGGIYLFGSYIITRIDANTFTIVASAAASSAATVAGVNPQVVSFGANRTAPLAIAATLAGTLDVRDSIEVGTDMTIVSDVVPTPNFYMRGSLSGSSTITGSDGVILDYRNVESDTVDIGDSVIYGHKLLWRTGAGQTGSRFGSQISMRRNVATTLVDVGDSLIPFVASINVSANAGGAASGFGTTQFGKGAYWGHNVVVNLEDGATYAKSMHGMEFNLQAHTGSSVSVRAGLLFSTGSDGTQQGENYDALLWASSQNGAVGWRHGFLFGSSGNAISADGYFMTSQVGGVDLTSNVVAGGIDFLQSDITGSGAAGGGFAFRMDGGRLEPGTANGGGIRLGHGRFYSTATGATLDVSDDHVTAVSVNNGGTGWLANAYAEDTLGNLVQVATVSAGVVTGVTLIKGAWGSTTPATSAFTPISFRNAAGAGLVLNLTWTPQTTLNIQPSSGKTDWGSTEFRRVTVFPTGGDAPSAGMRTFDVKRVGNDDSAIPGTADWVSRFYWVLTGGTGAERGPRFNTYVATDSQAGAEPGETWGLTSVMKTQASVDSYAAVSAYVQMVRDAVPSGIGAGKVGVAMLGGVVESRDLTEQPTSISGAVRTLELDLFANGADDTSIGREVIPIQLRKHNAAGAPLEVRSVIGVYADSDTTISWFARPNVRFDTSLYDCRGSTQLAGAHVFWAKTNQSIALDDAGAAGPYGNDANTSISSNGTTVTLTGVLAMGAGNSTIRSGSGIPAAIHPKGSLFLRTDGGVGTTLYVSQGGGAWNAVAGV